MQPVNLIPTPRREARRSRALIRRWAGAVVVYAAVIGAGALACRWTWAPQQADLSDELARSQGVADRLGELIKRQNERLDEQTVSLRLQRDTANHPDWSILLATLSDHLGDKVVLHRCTVEPIDPPTHTTPSPMTAAGVPAPAPIPTTLRPRRFSVRIGGYAANSGEVSSLLLRIERTGLFSTVKLVKGDRATYRSTPVVAFDIECTLDGRGEPNA